jgi:hypothetical protein
MARAVTGRRFCLTEEGFAGLVPISTKNGDKICIFQTCAVPYVLREIEGGYTLIGDCYIHGIMHGEALSTDPEMVDLRLR